MKTNNRTYIGNVFTDRGRGKTSRIHMREVTKDETGSRMNNENEKNTVTMKLCL